MKNNMMSFTSALCWLSFWFGAVLVGASWLYARLQEKVFLTGLDKGLLELTSPDSTVALMLSIGIMMVALGLIYVPLYYSAIFIGNTVAILSRKPIRI